MRTSSARLKTLVFPVVTVGVLSLFILFMSRASSSVVEPQDNNGKGLQVGLQFEMLKQTTATIPGNFYRTKVPGGWIVALASLNSGQYVEMIFIPDAEHTWDGKSLK